MWQTCSRGHGQRPTGPQPVHWLDRPRGLLPLESGPTRPAPYHPLPPRAASASGTHTPPYWPTSPTEVNSDRDSGSSSLWEVTGWSPTNPRSRWKKIHLRPGWKVFHHQPEWEIIHLSSRWKVFHHQPEWELIHLSSRWKVFHPWPEQ